jgi:hypothetical protein
MEGDWLIKRIMRDEKDRRAGLRRAVAEPPPAERRNLGWIVAALLLGILIGVIGLLGSAWFVVD